MPYIVQSDRERINKGDLPENAGQLNYKITTIIHTYVKTKGLNYQTINDIVGVLVSAMAEFQRRVVSPYEDTKIKDNGDI